MINGPSKSVALIFKSVLGFLYVVPLLWIVITSFKSNADILQAPNSLFFEPSLEIYSEVIGEGFGAILTSLQVAVFTTTIVLGLGVPAAHALAFRISPLWNRILTVVLGALLVLQMVPQPMTVIPLYSVLAGWGLLGTLPGLILADVALLLPFAVMLLRPYVLAIPNALYEAAEIDGASRFQSFRSITVPMLSNGIMTVLVVIFITAWGEFVYAVNFLPAGTTLPVSGLLAQQVSIYSVSWNSMMALAVLTSLPLVIVFIFAQKRLINGLSFGAVEVMAAMVEEGSRTIALVGSLDSKGEEYRFVRDRIVNSGLKTVLIDVGVLGSPGVEPDVDRAQVAQAADADIAELASKGDRNAAMIAMARGAQRIVKEQGAAGQIHGVLVLGGSNAGFVMSQIAQSVPIGFPKMLVSTIVAGDTRPYVGTTDLTMMYPVEDIAGLNSVSTPLLARAAAACVGMVLGGDVAEAGTEKPLIGMTMFGVTTDCVTAVQKAAMSSGWEPHVFHATGTGGRTLEAMIGSGLLAAVADVTTTELADDLLGGVCSAGPDRLTAAAGCGVPQVVSVGALDMANFGAPDTIPERFDGRLFHAHNPAVTLMRTNAAECAELGRIMAERLNRSTSFVEVHVPMRGFSQISAAGQPFHDPEADEALVASLREHLDARIPLRVHDLEINDSRFASEVSQALSRALDPRKGK